MRRRGWWQCAGAIILAAFGWTAPCEATRQYWVHGTDALSTSATEYTWQSGGMTTQVAGDILVPAAGTLEDLYVELTETPHPTSASANYRFMVQHYDESAGGPWQDTNIWCSIHGNGGLSCEDLTSSVSVDAGDRVVLQVTPISGVTATPLARWGVWFTPDTPNQTWLVGSTGASIFKTGTEEYTSIGTLDTPDTTRSNHEIIIPDNGDITNFRVRVETPITDGELDVFLCVNGTCSTSTPYCIIWKFPGFGGVPQMCSSGQRVEVSEGDRLAVFLDPYQSSPPDIASTVDVAAVFEPAHYGAFPMVSISTNNAIVNNATRYSFVNSGKLQMFTTEQEAFQLAPATFDIKQLFVGLDAAPGSGKSYTFTTRRCTTPATCADTDLSCTVTGGATSCQDTGTADLAAGREVTMKVVPSGTPTATKARFSVLGIGPGSSRRITIQNMP